MVMLPNPNYERLRLAPQERPFLGLGAANIWINLRQWREGVYRDYFRVA